MNAVLGWVLAAVLFAVATATYGWQGALAALSATVFWLLLQFTRSLRAMQKAGQRPVGSIGSAVMFNAQLRPGLTMLQVIHMTGSLGRKLGTDGDRWEWSDEGGSRVELDFRGGRLATFSLDRSAEVGGAAAADPAAAARPEPPAAA